MLRTKECDRTDSGRGGNVCARCGPLSGARSLRGAAAQARIRFREHAVGVLTPHPDMEPVYAELVFILERGSLKLRRVLHHGVGNRELRRDKLRAPACAARLVHQRVGGLRIDDTIEEAGEVDVHLANRSFIPYLARVKQDEALLKGNVQVVIARRCRPDRGEILVAIGNERRERSPNSGLLARGDWGVAAARRE